jgi:hypothetical protein
MPFSAVALSETHFFLVNTSITCTRGLAVIHQALRTYIFAIASIRTYARFIHYIAIRTYWCRSCSELSLVESRPHTSRSHTNALWHAEDLTTVLFRDFQRASNDSDNNFVHIAPHIVSSHLVESTTNEPRLPTDTNCAHLPKPKKPEPQCSLPCTKSSSVPQLPSPLAAPAQAQSTSPRAAPPQMPGTPRGLWITSRTRSFRRWSCAVCVRKQESWTRCSRSISERLRARLGLGKGGERG